MNGERKRYLFPFILVALSLSLSLLIAEIVVRHLWPPHRGFGLHNKLFVEYHPLLGWTKVSNFEGIHRTSEYSITEKMNSRGIRGPEYSYAKKKNETRIMILGDSFAEGFCVEFYDLFSESLKTELNMLNTTYHEVINTGTAGWSTDQEYLFFTTEGFKYQPDIVMLFFYHNDVWPNGQPKYWRGGKPLFKLDNNNLILTNTPVPKPLPRKRPPWYRSVVRWLYDHSDLCYWSKVALYEATLRFQYLAELIITQSRSDEPCRSLPDFWTVFELKPKSPAIHRAWEITERLLIELRNAVEKAKAKFIIVYVPWRGNIYKSEWNDFLRKYCLDPVKWDIDQPCQRLAEFCNREGINWYDLTEPLREYAESMGSRGKPLYFVYDGHWNSLGNKHVGWLLARYLQDMSLLQ